MRRTVIMPTVKEWSRYSPPIRSPKVPEKVTALTFTNAEIALRFNLAIKLFLLRRRKGYTIETRLTSGGKK